MPGFNGERTEPATPKKRQEARRKGHIPKTRELPSAMLILSLGMVFYFYGASFNQKLMKAFQSYWLNINRPLTPETVFGIFVYSIKNMMSLIAPMLITFLSISIFSYVIQFGFVLSTDPITPDLSRINPINGLKRLFSLSSIAELLKSLIKLFVIGYVAYRVLAPEARNILSYIELPVGQVLLYTSKLSLKLIFCAGLALLALSVLDYLFQRYQYEQNLRMTKQEVKEELKEREGDPKIKARMRSLQRQMAMSRMMQEVPKSDVIITNPVRIAVAIRYDSKSMYAPKVVAKGYGSIASRIKEVARRYGIPVIENRWLARMLVRVEVGGYIPAKLYRAVAEILAYIYQLRGNYHEVA